MGTAPFGFLFGALLLAVVLGALGVAARELRRKLLPGLDGSIALVAEIVLVVDGLTLVGLLLGTFGQFRRWVLVAAVLLVAGAVIVVGRRIAPVASRLAPVVDEPREGARLRAGLAAGGVVLVVAQWAAHTAAGLRLGMRDSVDTLWYHGPFAARFAQTGSTTAVHHVDLNPVTTFYPAGTSVLHGEGILLFGRDAASPLLNLAFLALTLLAAAAIGRRFGTVAPSLLAALVVLGAPMIVGDLRYGQPGGEYNDVVALSLVLAAIALLVRCGATRPGLVLAASSAGLAAGSKVSMLAPVAVLTLGVVVLADGRRLRTLAWWLGGCLATGGYWYVRNTAVAGSPLPGVDIGLGPLSLRSLPRPTTQTIASFLLDRHVLHSIFVPTLHRVIGPAWWLVLLLVVGGGLAAVVAGRERVVRVLGGMTLLSLGTYLVTPVFIGDPPIFFDTSVRFAVVTLVLGPISLAAVPAMRRAVPTTVLTGVLAAALLSHEVAWRRLWVGRHDVAVGLVAVAAVLGVWLMARQPSVAPRLRTALTATLVIALVLGATAVQRDQRHHRSDRTFAGFDMRVLGPVLGRHHKRIATDNLYLQYPLYGYDLSNHVDFIGNRGSWGAFTALDTCRLWKAAVNAGHYDLLVVSADHYPVKPLAVPPAWSWARTEIGHGLRQLSHDRKYAATFEVLGKLDPNRCPGST